MFGRTYTDIANNNDFANYIYSPDYKTVFSTIKQQISRGERMIATNCRIVTIRGEIYSVSFSGCISYENGLSLMDCVFFNIKLNRSGEHIPEKADLNLFKKNLAVFDNMPIAFIASGVLLDKDDKPYDIIIDYANEAAGRLLNIDIKLVVAKRYYSVLGNNDSRILAACYDAAYNNKTTDTIRLHSQTGRYVHYMCYPICRGYAVFIAEDVSDNVASTRKANILENYVREVPANLRTGIVQYLDDEYRTIVYANDSAYKMFGYEKDEFRQKFTNRLDAILETTENTRKADREIAKLCLYEPSYSFERFIYTKSGGKRRFIENTMRIINADGLEVLQSEFIDTEELTSNKNELEFFERISSYMIVKYHVKDKLIILSANSRFYEFFGIDKKCYDGNPLLRTHEDDMNIVSKAMISIADGEDVDFIYRTDIPGKKEHCFHVYGGCVGYKLGYPIYVMLFNDITPMRELKNEVEYEKQRSEIFLKSTKDIVIEYTVNSDTLKVYINIPDGNYTHIDCIVYEKFSKTADSGKFIHSEDFSKMLGIMSGEKSENNFVRAKCLSNPGDEKSYIYSVSGNLLKGHACSDKFVGYMHRIPQRAAVLPSEEAIINAVSNKFVKKCDLIVSVDIHTGYYRHLRIKNGVLRKTDFGDYNLDVFDYAKKYINTDDYDNFIDNMSIEGMIRILSANESFMYMFSSRVNNNVRFKAAEFSYIDEKKEIIYLQVMDISDFYRNTGSSVNSEIAGNLLIRTAKNIIMPLNMITSMITTAKNHNIVSEQMNKYLNKINTCSLSVSELMANMIEIIKLENGKFNIENEIFSVKDLISNINSAAAPALNMKNISFSISADGLEEYYIGDNIKIEHIIMILINNASDFTPPKGHIDLSLKALPKNEVMQNIIISVTDSGVGIPKDVFKNIFDLYFFGDDNHINTEITLAIVKLTVAALGGSIDIESQTGRTCFTINIPLRLCGNTDKFIRHNRLHKNILIVNESILYLESLLGELSEYIDNIDIAIGGRDAMTTYLHSVDGYYDYIIIDMNTDNNKGEDIITKIRLSNRNDSATVKILAASVADMSLPAGADECISHADEISKIYEIFGNNDYKNKK